MARFACTQPATNDDGSSRVGDFLPREPNLSVADAARKYREEYTSKDYKHKTDDGTMKENGAVALLLEPL